jgi:hypothetical protein
LSLSSLTVSGHEAQRSSRSPKSTWAKRQRLTPGGEQSFFRSGAIVTERCSINASSESYKNPVTATHTGQHGRSRPFAMMTTQIVTCGFCSTRASVAA